MTYEIGELYYGPTIGLVCVTEPIGGGVFRAVRLRSNSGYRVGEFSNIRKATDTDIIDFLTYEMLNFPVSTKVSLSIDAGTDVVLISDERECIVLEKEDIPALIAILKREINL